MVFKPTLAKPYKSVIIPIVHYQKYLRLTYFRYIQLGPSKGVLLKQINIFLKRRALLKFHMIRDIVFGYYYLRCYKNEIQYRV